MKAECWERRFGGTDCRFWCRELNPWCTAGSALQVRDSEQNILSQTPGMGQVEMEPSP